MSVDIVETLETDSADYVRQKSRAWDFLHSAAVTSSMRSPVSYESDAIVGITFFSDDELADEALWDKQFAESQELIDTMADEALAEHLAGLTEEFDPDNDFDML